MDVVRFEEVVKDYPTRLWGRERLRAVDRVSLSIAPGEAIGLLGPNRAGKTTLIKLLLSLCQPTSGRVFRLGEPAQHRGTLQRIGYVHENPAFPRYLSATALLHYFGALTYLTEPHVRQIVPGLLKRVGLADRSHEPISRFSKGMIQRLGVAQALLSDPDLLVLDEPSEGLDLLGRQMVRDVIAEQKGKGKAVLFVSHVLSEVENVCDRVAVLVQGQLKFLGTLKQLQAEPSGAKKTLESALQPYYDASVGTKEGSE